MKTQVNKRNDNQTREILMLAIYFIVLAGMFLITEDRSEFDPWPKLNENVNSLVNAMNSRIAPASEIPDFETAPSLEQLNAFLIPAEEAKLTLSKVKSIHYPDVKMDQNESRTDKNEYLLLLAKEKNDELVEYYSLVAKVKKYLAEEVEKPLKIESWMIDDTCWCTDSEEVLLTKK